MPRKKPSELDWSDLFGEPEGWRALQEQAKSEQDPRKLEAIIAEMNQLLSECEKKAAHGKGPRPTSRRASPKRSSVVE